MRGRTTIKLKRPELVLGGVEEGGGPAHAVANRLGGAGGEGRGEGGGGEGERGGGRERQETSERERR